MENTQQRPPHVAIVPTPGLGHLIPLVELAKRLVLLHGFRVTLLIPNDGSSPMEAQNQLLQALPDSISSISLPPVNFDDLPDALMETRIALTLTRSLPAFRDSFKVLAESTRLVALVVDLFGVEAFDVAKEFGVLSYIFYPSTAMTLSLAFYLPTLDEEFSGEYKDLLEPVKLPGCVPVHGSDLIDAVKDRNDMAYKGVVHICKCFPLADGIMVNSFLDLESGAFKALMGGDQPGVPPVYPIGPMIRIDSSDGIDGSGCLKWLDEQPSESVLFICFGSGGTLSIEQLKELALGLEMSGQRFLWVVKNPNDKAANATYFGAQKNVKHKDLLDFLPNGFLDRTKGLGLVVPSWAPQLQVLSHGSTGGFLTHCGWNSTLESIVNGVPLIAWPLYAEQRMNAVLLADDLKVALRVKVSESGIVGSEDIAKYARGLMEGEDGKLLRSKMRELKDTASRVLSQNGSSTKSLSKVVEIWKNQRP